MTVPICVLREPELRADGRLALRDADAIEIEQGGQRRRIPQQRASRGRRRRRGGGHILARRRSGRHGRWGHSANYSAGTWRTPPSVNAAGWRYHPAVRTNLVLLTAALTLPLVARAPRVDAPPVKVAVAVNRPGAAIPSTILRCLLRGHQLRGRRRHLCGASEEPLVRVSRSAHGLAPRDAHRRGRTFLGRDRRRPRARPTRTTSA